MDNALIQALQSIAAKLTRSEQTPDGWVQVPVSEVWTYASASTLTIPGDYTSKYQKYDKIWLTQTTGKYFYIKDIVYSGGTTTVTVYAGSVYTLANAAITAMYYSKVQSPQGFPQRFAFTPTWTNLTVGNGVSDSYFSVLNGRVVVDLCFTLGTTSSVGTNPLMDLPFTSKTIQSSKFPIGHAIYNNNSASSKTGHVLHNSTTTAAFHSMDINADSSQLAATTPFSWGTSFILMARVEYTGA